MAALAVPSQPSLATQCVTTLGQGAFCIVANTGAGYIAGSAFSIINPIGGAIFGGSYALTSMVADGIMNAVGCNKVNNVALQIAKLVIANVLGAVAATFAVAAAGFPITFAAAAMLVGGMFAISMVITAVVACCICGCVGATAVAGNALGATVMHTAERADIPA